MSDSKVLAVLYQATPPPPDEWGTPKPMKKGGYKDSGADICFCLRKCGVQIVTISELPRDRCDDDWAFPDTISYLPWGKRKSCSIMLTKSVYGQTLYYLEIILCTNSAKKLFDDKYATNCFLRKKGLTVAPSFLVSLESSTDNSVVSLKGLTEERLRKDFHMCFPLVVKPVRGRGSEGVVKVEDFANFQKEVESLLQATEIVNNEVVSKYGKRVIVEQFLSGQEVTITVMPPGTYVFEDEKKTFPDYWALPVVKRFNHIHGIAPYNGVVAVVQNSSLLEDNEKGQSKYLEAMQQCEKAARAVGAKAPIRVDCREDNGKFFLFDLNMKPNMTGPGRPGRDDQDSLVCIAAAGVGWTFSQLMMNMIQQDWPAEEMLTDSLTHL